MSLYNRYRVIRFIGFRAALTAIVTLMFEYVTECELNVIVTYVCAGYVVLLSGLS